MAMYAMRCMWPENDTTIDLTGSTAEASNRHTCELVSTCQELLNWWSSTKLKTELQFKYLT